MPLETEFASVGAAALAAAALTGEDPYKVARRWGREAVAATCARRPPDGERRARIRFVRERLDELNSAGSAPPATS